MQLVFPEGLLELNATGARVVGLCDGRRSIDEIVATLAPEFDCPRDVLSRDVLAYVERLQQRGLLRLSDAT